MVELGSRLPVVHVVAHDGSAPAQQAFERVSALTEVTVLVFRVASPPEDARETMFETAVPTLTVDRILRIARDNRAAYVTIPSSLFSADGVLLSAIDAIARLATPEWPAVAVQVLRSKPPRTVRRVLAVASHGQSSGAMLLMETLAALINGASLTNLVVGGEGEERVRPGVRGPDADLVVTGMGGMPPGLTHRDLTRSGRRRLLAGPLRIEHTVLRSTPADAVMVIDAARLRRRTAREGGVPQGLAEHFVGDLARLEEMIEVERQDKNQAAESGSS